MIINKPEDALAYAKLLEAVARGKTIQLKGLWEAGQKELTWKDLSFSSTSIDFNHEHTYFRVKPDTKAYRVGVTRDTDGRDYTVSADTEEEADRYESSGRFLRWLTDWVEYEVPS